MACFGKCYAIGAMVEFYIGKYVLRSTEVIITRAGVSVPELGILPAAGSRAQIKDQNEPELSLKFRTGDGATAI